MLAGFQRNGFPGPLDIYRALQRYFDWPQREASDAVNEALIMFFKPIK